MSAKSDHTVYLALKDEISYGQIRPNVYMNVSQIAADHGVSIAPVREALIRLSSEDIIDYYPTRGFFVRALELSEIQESYFVIYTLADRALYHLSHSNNSYVGEGIASAIENLKSTTIDNIDGLRSFEAALEQLGRLLMLNTALRIYLNLLAKTRPFRSVIYIHYDRAGQIFNGVREIFGLLRRAEFVEARRQNRRLLKARIMHLSNEYQFYVAFLKRYECTIDSDISI